tara:strand:+ start:100 stop:342 length:243 start_codon:yes stop_codon:yes gene_type:complete
LLGLALGDGINAIALPPAPVFSPPQGRLTAPWLPFIGASKSNPDLGFKCESAALLGLYVLGKDLPPFGKERGEQFLPSQD